MSISTQQSANIGRGYLLLGVFCVHALYTILAMLDPHKFISAAIMIKLLAPNVAAFFFLSGMSSRNLGRKDVPTLLRQSLMLVLLAHASHLIAEVLRQYLFYQKPNREFLSDLVMPLITGVGHANFIAWFFLALAAARIYAWTFERSKKWFIVLAAITAGMMAAATRLGLPDIYQWSNWPFAFLFLLCGMHLPNKLSIRWFTALPCLILSVGIGWVNRPGLLGNPMCVTCGLDFVAQPTIGEYGILPLYLVQQLLFLVFLLWLSSMSLGSLAGNVARYFGQRSMKMLVMHGWIIAVLYPLTARQLPEQESIFLFVAILSSVIVVHAFTYEIIKTPLSRFVEFIIRLSDGIVNRVAMVVRRKRSVA